MLEAVLKWRIDDVIEEVLEDYTVSTNADFVNILVQIKLRLKMFKCCSVSFKGSSIYINTVSDFIVSECARL